MPFKDYQPFQQLSKSNQGREQKKESLYRERDIFEKLSDFWYIPLCEIDDIQKEHEQIRKDYNQLFKQRKNIPRLEEWEILAFCVYKHVITHEYPYEKDDVLYLFQIRDKTNFLFQIPKLLNIDMKPNFRHFINLFSKDLNLSFKTKEIIFHICETLRPSYTFFQTKLFTLLIILFCNDVLFHLPSLTILLNRKICSHVYIKKIMEREISLKSQVKELCLKYME